VISGTDLDAAALERLRQLLARLADGASLAEVVRLARDLRVKSGVTVDFGATRELGQPIVVVRAPPLPVPSTSLATLTPREREVAALVALGRSNKQIARTLGLTVGTVKYHVHHILEKTALPGRVALAQAHREATQLPAPAPSIFG
jgi:DNA-binding CsgD family transcriptional regulator